MKNLGFAVFTTLIVLSLAACTKKAPAEKVVNLAIWGNYLDPEEQKLLLEATGIKLNITNYASNEDLQAKLQAGATGFDVAVPSDYMVDILRKTNQLQKLDRSKIPNFSEIDPAFLNQAYDSANEYSVPYAWTMTGLAVNRDLYKGSLKSWKDLLNAKDLAGKISLLDDAREALGAALKSQGFSYNSTDADEIKKARTVLEEARSRIKMFRSDMVDPLVNKEVAAAQAYSVDTNQAWRRTQGKIEFVFPEEGTTSAIDNLVILKGAKHIDEAHALINFLLQPRVNAIFVQKIMAGPVLTKTKSLLPADLQNNPSLFPPKDRTARMEKIRDVGQATRLFDEAWTEVKSK